MSERNDLPNWRDSARSGSTADTSVAAEWAAPEGASAADDCIAGESALPGRAESV
jgi:hypothetical protein